MYQVNNVLYAMLREDEKKRISSPMLALIMQHDKVLLSNIIVPHPDLFPPIFQQLENRPNECRIQYIIKSLLYEGQFISTQKDTIKIREGRGKLYKQIRK